MKKVLIILIFAFLIAGGTVGILYQEGFGGVQKKLPDASVDQQVADTDISVDQADGQEFTGTYDSGITSEDVSSDTDEIDMDNVGVGTDTSNIEPATEEPVDIDDTSVDTEEDLDTDTESAFDTDTEVSEETTEEEEAADAAKKAEKEKKGPFYSVKVLGINGGGLTLHENASGQGDSMCTVSKNTTGYMIGSRSTGTRRLCYIDGKIGYLSKNYTEVTEIDADEYPDALLSVTEADSGKDFSLD